MDFPKVWQGSNRSVWHSVVVFFVPFIGLSFDAFFLNNGSEADMLSLSTLVYSSAVIVVNFKLLLNSRYWTMPFVLSIVSSLLLLFLINLIYAVINTEKWINQQMFFVFIELICSPCFWLLSILSVCIALLPDITFIVISNYKRAQKDPTLKFTSNMLCCIRRKERWSLQVRTEFNKKSGRISMMRPMQNRVLVDAQHSNTGQETETHELESREILTADI